MQRYFPVFDGKRSMRGYATFKECVEYTLTEKNLLWFLDWAIYDSKLNVTIESEKATQIWEKLK